MNAGDICTREVVIVEADQPLAKAAQLMRDHHVGDVVVVERHGDTNLPIGILTDRDMVIGPLATAPDEIAQRTVGDVATMEIVTVTVHEDVLAVLEKMRVYAVRRLPVVEGDGRLIGIVAFDDIVEVLAKELARVGLLASRAEHREERRGLRLH